MHAGCLSVPPGPRLSLVGVVDIDQRMKFDVIFLLFILSKVFNEFRQLV